MVTISLFELRRRDGQIDLPGTKPSLDVDKPMRGRKSQKDCDIGLFSNEADQLNLKLMNS
jgi:hypothetical protein